MARQPLNELPSDLLRRRKKIFTILCLLMVFPLIINGLLYFYLLVKGKPADVSLLVPAMAIFVIAIPIYTRIKAIEEELQNRGEG